MINIPRISWKNKKLEFILCQWPNIKKKKNKRTRQIISFSNMSEIL